MTTIIIALDHDDCAMFYAALNSAQDPYVIFKGKLLAHFIERINSVYHFDPHAKIYVTCLSARQSSLINQYNSLKHSNLSAGYVLEAVAIALAQHFRTQVYFDTNLLADSFPGEHMQQQFLIPLDYRRMKRPKTDDDDIYNKLLVNGYLNNRQEINGKLSYGMKLARLRQIISMFPLNEMIYLYVYDDYAKYLYYLKWYFVNTTKDSRLKTEFWLVDPFDWDSDCAEDKKTVPFCKLEKIVTYLKAENWRQAWQFRYCPELMQAVYTVKPSSEASRLSSVEHTTLMAKQYALRNRTVCYGNIIADLGR